MNPDASTPPAPEEMEKLPKALQDFIFLPPRNPMDRLVRDYIIHLQQERDQLRTFAERMYTLTDWHPGSARDRIESVMKMAHDVLYPPTPKP